MKRRHFIKSGIVFSTAYATGLVSTACSGKQSKSINKRETVLSLIHDDKPQEYYPGSFSLHFGEGNRTGEAAINKHLEYFRYTGVDLYKIQYEKMFPHIPAIHKPADWSQMPLYKKDFYNEPLAVIEGIIKKAKKEAPVIATLYSPCACLRHTTSNEMMIRHMEEDPEQVKKGLEIITESLMIYVRECIRLGVDGFLQSTQGGESGRFSDYRLFTEYLKPFDLILGKEMEEHCPCNILHICDYLGNYDDYDAFVDYPGHIINTSLQLTNKTITTKNLYRLFNRPIMGGMHKKGVITSGSQAKITAKVKKVLSEAPEKFILGASCTIPDNTDRDSIKTALDTAHNFFT